MISQGDQMNRWLVIAAAAALMSGCATIVEGTDQKITVEVSPQTATCVATRQGEQIGGVGPGNRILAVSKSRHDIELRCSAPGHQAADTKIVSSASGWGIAGAVTLDLGLIDWASGALNKYPERVTIALVPQ
jgi:uncharacterized protein YceK